MTTMPKRYAGVLATELLQERLQILTSVERERAATRGRRGALWLGIAALIAAPILLLDVRADQATGAPGAPFGPGAVVSAQVAGVGAHPSDFESRTPAPSPAPPGPAPALAEAPPIPDPEDRLSPREILHSMDRPRRAPRTTTTRAPAAPKAPRIIDVPFPDDDPAPDLAQLRQTLMALAQGTETPAPGAPQKAAPKRIVPVGTRIQVRLLAPTTTSLTGSPVSAALTTNLQIGSATLIPAGAQVVGDAYATPESDRAQIVWKALVTGDGRSLQLDGACLGTDGDLGLPARLVRKASRTRRGVGHVLGSIGSALTFGLVGSNGVAQRAASAASSRVGNSLTGIEQDWTLSDKGLRVESGALAVVFLRGDLELP